MTDQNARINDPGTPPVVENANAAAEKAAKDYEKTREKKPGWKYRFVTSGGETHVVATKIAKD